MTKPSDPAAVSTPAAPPATPPGADLRLQSGPTVTNHGNQEVELKIESIENMGSNLDLDPSSLEPGYRYRWVLKIPKKVSRAKARGYAIVDPATHRPIKNFVFDDLSPAEDGTITVGDVVLMRTKESYYRGRRKRLRKFAKERLQGPEKLFRGEAQKEAKDNRMSRQVKVINDEVDPQ